MEKELPNGLTATYLDESKKLAGDRWLVKFRCRVAMPLQGWMEDDLAGDDPQTVFCRAQFAHGLVYELVQERNFIDATVRETVLAELIAGLDQTLLAYLAKEAFVRQLFAVKRAEFAQAYVRQGWTESEGEGQDVPEPDDFSACFR